MHYLGTTCAAIFSHSDIVLLKLASCNCCVSICVHLNSIRTLWWSTCRHSHNFWDPPPTHTHTDINTNIQFAIIATWSVSNVVVRIYWRWQLLESRTYYKIKLDYDYFIFYFHFFTCLCVGTLHFRLGLTCASPGPHCHCHDDGWKTHTQQKRMAPQTGMWFYEWEKSWNK